MPAPAAAQEPAQARAEAASEDVPAALAERARAVVEGSPQLRSALSGPRTVFIGVDLIRRKGERGRDAPPLYRVRHYRYADDTAITSLVDLNSGAVTEQSAVQHAAVPLSAGELAEAQALALADRRVAEAVARYRDRLVIEPLVVRTSEPTDPWFGRRVVRLLFRIGADYLSSPMVYVDLSRREVTVQPGHGRSQGDPR